MLAASPDSFPQCLSTEGGRETAQYLSFSEHARGPELGPQNSHGKIDVLERAIPEPGRQRQANAWGSLATLVYSTKLQAFSRNPRWIGFEKQPQRLTSDIHLHTLAYRRSSL